MKILFGCLLIACTLQSGIMKSAPQTKKLKATVDSTVTSIRAMRHSVVQIKFESDSPDPKLQFGVAGTGFFVNREGYVITAAHVVNGTIAAAFEPTWIKLSQNSERISG